MPKMVKKVTMSLINMEVNPAKNCQKGNHAKNGLKGNHEPYKHGGKPCQKWSKG